MATAKKTAAKKTPAKRASRRAKKPRRIAPAVEHLSRPVDELKLLRGNPRKGDLAATKRSLERFGQRYPIVVRNGEVIAGNHRLEAAIALGWNEIAVVDADDLTAAEAKAFALADNRTGDLATYDEELLGEMLGGLNADLQLAAGYTSADIAALIGDPEIKGDPDELPKIDEAEPPITQTGDLWLLGDHRVLCGDSTSIADLERLMGDRRADAMITDPPYGIDYAATNDFRQEMRGSSRADGGAVANDGRAEAIELWAAAFPLLAGYLAERSAFYVWSSGGDQLIDLGLALREAGLRTHGMVVWVKSSFTFSRAEHKGQHEPAFFGTSFYGWPEASVHDWHGPGNESSVWEHQRPSRSPLHPTQKPFDVIERCVGNITERGDLVLDPFLGSGTTLIAAHAGSRTCYGLELKPEHVDTICARWQKATGIVPVLDGQGDVDFGENR